MPASGDAFLRVQRTAESVPRCHLDLHVERVDETAEHAVHLGAQVVGEPAGIVVMASPGGFPFCVVSHREQGTPTAPDALARGLSQPGRPALPRHPSRRLRRGKRVWATLTGWERRSGPRPEFEHLGRSPGMPLRLLLQRLDDDRSARCLSHLDLACEDVDAEVHRHEALGAEVVRAMPGWTTLLDPSGLAYCVTRRSPGTGTFVAAT